MEESKYLEAKGARVATNRQAQHGIGILADNYSFAPEKVDFCQGLNKQGAQCRARPVKNRMLCIGHLRQVEKNDETAVN